jgi:hypothetical protein
MSFGSSRPDLSPKPRVYCTILPLREIDWFAIKLQSDRTSYWDNNRGWNYSIEHERKRGMVPLYQSPNTQYMYHFERYDTTEIDGDWDGPGKDYGSNIYLPMLDDWKEEVLRSPLI